MQLWAPWLPPTFGTLWKASDRLDLHTWSSFYHIQRRIPKWVLAREDYHTPINLSFLWKEIAVCATCVTKSKHGNHWRAFCTKPFAKMEYKGYLLFGFPSFSVKHNLRGSGCILCKSNKSQRGLNGSPVTHINKHSHSWPLYSFIAKVWLISCTEVPPFSTSSISLTTNSSPFNAQFSKNRDFFLLFI